MKTRQLIDSLALLVLSGSLVTAAPLGTAFTYQGRLEQDGGPATGLYDFLFRLYDAPSAGKQVGANFATNGVPVSEGLFLVQLDFGSEAFTGEERWLQISVQTNGATRFTTLSPRQMVSPTPYAQFAQNARAAAAATFASMAGGVAGSNLTATADDTLNLRAPSIVLESDRFTNTVTSSASQVIGMNSEVVVGAHMTVGVGGNYHRTVGGDVTETLGKDLITDVARNHALSVGGNMALDVGETLNATCAQAASIDVGAAFLLRANDEIWLTSGTASLNMKKSGDITIKGKRINIKGSGEIVMKQGAAFRSAATETNDTTIGILGESATTNGIGVFGISTLTAIDDVHVGVLAVATEGNKNLALLANCVTNDLLPATAVPRPAAIAARVHEKQDLIQGYGNGDVLRFRVSDGGAVIATGFEGNGAGLTGIGSGALDDNSVTAAKIVDGSVADADLANDAVTSTKIADGTIGAADVAANTFWGTAGNAGTTAGTHFLGTTDNRPIEIKVNGQRALRLEPNTTGAPNVIGGSSRNSVAAGVVGATIGGGGATNLYGQGFTNRVSGDFGTIGGGIDNAVQFGYYATIGGGIRNSIEFFATAATIGGGWANTIQTNAMQATIGGGWANRIRTNAENATIGGGVGNDIGTDAACSTLSGGSNNTVAANARFAAVGGGVGNTASGAGAVIAGGGHDGSNVSGNTASAPGSAIGGGTQNLASGSRSTVGGGHNNTATNWYATVPGGAWNFAGGQGSFAAGRAAKAFHDGALVWNDDSASDLVSTNARSVSIRAAGGYRLFSNSGATAGVYLAPGGGSWTSLSDRHAKENLEAVNVQAVLAKVATLPLSTWNYQSQDASIRHIGPMAQDFKAAFGLGESDTGITSVDADGVALAAIQGLNQKLEARSQRSEVRSQKLEAENAMLKQEVAELKVLVQTLAEKVNGGGQ